MTYQIRFTELISEMTLNKYFVSSSSSVPVIVGDERVDDCVGDENVLFYCIDFDDGCP